MDDNQTQATTGYQSKYKRMSGCEKKRDSSFLVFGISPSKKLISDLVAGFRFFPGAVALQKNNSPINTRTETMFCTPYSVSMVNMRSAMGLIKDRGGEKKGSSHQDHIGPLIIRYPLIAGSKYGGFLASFPQHRPAFE